MPFATVPRRIRGFGRHPASVCLLLGYQCPLSCAFCSNPRRRPRETKVTGAVKELLLRWSPLRVALTGGEPLCYRSQLIDVAKLLANVGSTTVVATSGVGLGDPRELCAVSQFDVSLHALSPSDYKKRRGLDLFGETIRSVEMLVGHGINVAVNYIVWPGSVDELLSLPGFVASLGVRVLRIEVACGVGSACKFPVVADRRRLLQILTSMEIPKGMSVYYPTVGPRLGRLLTWGTLVVEYSGRICYCCSQPGYLLAQAEDILNGKALIPNLHICANHELHTFPDESAWREFVRWCTTDPCGRAATTQADG